MNIKVCQVCSGPLVEEASVFKRTTKPLANKGYEVHLIATGEGTEICKSEGVGVHIHHYDSLAGKLTMWLVLFLGSPQIKAY